MRNKLTTAGFSAASPSTDDKPSAFAVTDDEELFRQLLVLIDNLPPRQSLNSRGVFFWPHTMTLAP